MLVRVSVPQPPGMASLTPSATPKAVASPTVATIEPVNPKYNADRFERIIGVITIASELRAKQIAVARAIRPGLESLLEI